MTGKQMNDKSNVKLENKTGILCKTWKNRVYDFNYNYSVWESLE